MRRWGSRNRWGAAGQIGGTRRPLRCGPTDWRGNGTRVASSGGTRIVRDCRGRPSEYCSEPAPSRDAAWGLCWSVGMVGIARRARAFSAPTCAGLAAAFFLAASDGPRVVLNALLRRCFASDLVWAYLPSLMSFVKARRHRNIATFALIGGL